MDPVLLLGGAIVSVVVQFIKKYFGDNTLGIAGSLIGLSVIGGVISWYLHLAGLWDSFVQIVVAAGAVYSYVLNNLETASPSFAAFFAPKAKG